MDTTDNPNKFNSVPVPFGAMKSIEFIQIKL